MESDDQRSIAPHVDLRSLDEVARYRLDRQLVDAIAEGVPGDQREGVRQVLTLPDGTIHSEISIPNGAPAPELAPVLPLLQQLMQLRAARDRPTEGVPHASVNHDPFRVVLFLAQDMQTDDGIAAVVIRRPGDAGVPLIVFPEHGFQPRDILLGVHVASELATRHPRNVEREQRAAYRRAAPRRVEAQAGASVTALAAVLREAPVISIPGVGLGRAYGFVPRQAPNP
jgi:hypothetical protein